MSAQSIIEQLLSKGLSSLGGGSAPRVPNDFGKYASGAAVGGVLGLLLGSQSGRRMGGKALKYGSVAALGALAYRAYNDYQARQAASAPSAAPAVPAFEPLPAPQVEAHSRALLKAMIAAAKSDGHLDERERGLVEAEMQRVAADDDTRRWFEEQLRRPLDPADVARSAGTPEMAAEMYLASLLVADETSYMERAYLDELARQLRLPDGLKLELERQALAA
jgi:uncharacterized membrane protein YebE (DUF533 family)